jgi:hypothetical protein
VFQQIRGVIKTTTTRHTAQTVFRSIEAKIARPWLAPASSAVDNTESEAGSNEVESAIQQSINKLGFMLRAPITVLATVPFVFGLPIWPWIAHSRSYRLKMDIICNRYEDDIIGPWIKSLKDEGERSLVGTIKMSSKVANNLVTSALEREDNRYKRELEGKMKPADQQIVLHLLAAYSNLVAAEEALRGLCSCVKNLNK